MAIGFIGDPVPPTTLSRDPTNKNVQQFLSLAASAKGSRSRLSRIGIPRPTNTNSCNGLARPSTPDGLTSLTPSELMTATSLAFSRGAIDACEPAAASLAMPYLEPYLIQSMREARPKITDPVLQRDLDLYIIQEATHSKQHKKFNKTIRDAGYTSVARIEHTLANDYKKLALTRSLRFNLAYAEGFESMALAIGHMLIEDREHLFRHSDSNVASLVLWHFVEEIEHKNVAFNVFNHLYGS